jgi:phosphoglycerate dehydrogenase-like enzyme
MSLSDLVVAVTVEIFPEGLDKLRGTFKTVHYHPDGDLPSDVASSVQLLLTTNKGLPPKFKSVQELPHLKHVQMISAGADKALASDRASAYAANPAVTLSTASGIHVLSIPNYVVAMVINIFNQIPRQIEISRVSDSHLNAG